MKDYMAFLDRMHCLEYDRSVYQQTAVFRFYFDTERCIVISGGVLSHTQVGNA